MLKYLYFLFWAKEETNSMCPNSFAYMPPGKFHNFAIERGEPCDDEVEDIPKQQKQIHKIEV